MIGVGHTLEHFGEVEVAVAARRMVALGIEMVGDGIVAVMHQRLVDAGGIRRVRLHKVHLPLQLAGVGPIVVALTEGDIAPAGGRQEDVVLDVDVLRIQVFLLAEGLDAFGETRGVVPDDVGGSVGGGVVIDKDLIVEIRLLHEKALQRLRDIGFMVKGRAEHGDHHSRSGHDSSPLRSGQAAVRHNIFYIIIRLRPLFNKKIAAAPAA